AIGPPPDSPSPVRSVARSAMNSRSHSVAGIIVQCIAHATSAHGGSRPASTRSRLPAGSGKRRAESSRGGLNDRHYLGRTTLSHPRTHLRRVRTSTPPQRRKNKPAYRIFPASRAKNGWLLSRIMTMWRPSAPLEEDVADPPGIGPQDKRRRSRRRAWRDGLADQTVVQGLEDVRSYRAFERALIGSVDPRSALELALAHRLASVLCRLRRASAIETGVFSDAEYTSIRTPAGRVPRT